MWNFWNHNLVTFWMYPASKLSSHSATDLMLHEIGAATRAIALSSVHPQSRRSPQPQFGERRFLTLVGFAGHAMTFWIYAAIMAGAWLFIYKLVPETKGKTPRTNRRGQEAQAEPARRNGVALEMISDRTPQNASVKKCTLMLQDVGPAFTVSSRTSVVPE
jgi:hypothetical protein